MQKLSKLTNFILFFTFFALLTTYYLLHTTYVSATLEAPEGKVEDPDPFPKIKYPCSSPGLDPEFHSLRPYQAAPCGGATLAKFCSNELIFIEEFDLANKPCEPKKQLGTHTFPCNPDAQVEEHDLYIELSGSELPILGNTEQVTNSQGGTEEFDDAQKVNEYASWYLSGVANRAEYGEPTEDQVVNYSGPVNKLIPQMIQQAERIKTIYNTTEEVGYIDGTGTGEDGKALESVKEVENHDQIVVCAQEKGLGFLGDFLGIGVTTPVPCYDKDKYRLKEWLGDLSTFNGIFNRIGTNIWNKRTPPLPWDDGTVTDPKQPKKPFESQIAYQKAYKEWQGASCATIPFIDVNLCLDNPFVPNKWANLYHYIPLSSTADKKGANYIKGDGPSYDAAAGTEIANPMHKSYSGAPLYFAHTQEVKELSELLNKTYRPEGFKDEKVAYPDDVEKIKKEVTGKDPITGKPIEGGDSCSLLNVRVNQGDNLFAGDKGGEYEMWVRGVQYKITQVECKETFLIEPCPTLLNPGKRCTTHIFHCPAYIKISIKTGTKTPNVEEIFRQTVADSGSTFRKMFPKTGEGSPVECIADIPTSTDVYYDPTKSDYPRTNTGAEGDNTFKVNPKPDDTPNDLPQLTFPHIGSVYEYFLKGIQTALRPKGYGDPIANGNCKPTTVIECGKVPETLPKPTGSCANSGISSRLGDLPQNLLDIVSAASETYKVPSSLILGIMFGEGRFNTTQGGGYTTYDWTEENVNNWATCEEMPKCHSIPYVYNAAIAISEDNWSRILHGIKDDIKKIAPNREISGCNLLDSIYGVAWLLRDNVDGGPFQIKSCFGKTLNTGQSTAKSCVWGDNDYITAIKINESGWTDMCFTKEYSCRDGGGRDAACPTGEDTCETISNRYAPLAASHMGCVFDVAKGN